MTQRPAVPSANLLPGRHFGAIAGVLLLAGFLLATLVAPAFAHTVESSDAQFVRSETGYAPWPFLYLGAKHMITGYDHLLFLTGIVFYLKRPRDILLLVSAFSLGHSLTLILGVAMHVGLNAALVDAIIGLSVLYKAVDNLGGLKALFSKPPALAPVIFGFGLIHGLGLSQSLLQLKPHGPGLWVNVVSFNFGVEVGQIIGLSIILGLLSLWRWSRWPGSRGTAVNWALCVSGLVIMGSRLTAYMLEVS